MAKITKLILILMLTIAAPSSQAASVESEALLREVQNVLQLLFPMTLHLRLYTAMLSQYSDLLFPGNSDMLVQAPLRATLVINDSPSATAYLMRPLSKINGITYRIYKFEDLLKTGEKPEVALLKGLTEFMTKKTHDERLHFAIDFTDETAASKQFLTDFFDLLSKQKAFNAREMAAIISVPPSAVMGDGLNNKMRKPELEAKLLAAGYPSELIQSMANIVFIDKTCPEVLIPNAAENQK